MKLILMVLALCVFSIEAQAKVCLKWQARSAVTGRFVSLDAARTNPRETVVSCRRWVAR